MSRLITRNNLHDFVSDGCLILEKGMLLSPGADDLAKIQGIGYPKRPGQLSRSIEKAHSSAPYRGIPYLFPRAYRTSSAGSITAPAQIILFFTSYSRD
ncbi:hypothetical protein [Endozoicomonas atrinae]|uniref:hypothetical protein n=1 Tax=Endozoicomonas atrinae TaxID=1333660 RepID=UPI003B00C7AE